MFGDTPDPAEVDSASSLDAAHARQASWTPLSSSATVRPLASRAGRLAVATMGLSIVVAIGAVGYAMRGPFAVDSFVAAVLGVASLIAAALAALLAVAHRSLHYRLDDSALTIEWPWLREVVPLGRIVAIYAGHRLGKRVRVKGLVWPGHYIGRSEAEGVGSVKFFGTSTDPSTAIIIATDGAAYAITPGKLDEFRSRLLELLEGLGDEATETAPDPSTEMAPLIRLPLLRDRIAMSILGVNVAAVLAIFAYLSVRLPALPPLIPLHVTASGDVDQMVSPADIFRTPLLGLAMLVLNGFGVAAIHRWRQDAGRVAALGMLFVGLLMLVVVLRVVH